MAKKLHPIDGGETKRMSVVDTPAELASCYFPNEPEEDADRSRLTRDIHAAVAGYGATPREIARRYCPVDGDRQTNLAADIEALLERERGR